MSVVPVSSNSFPCLNASTSFNPLNQVYGENGFRYKKAFLENLPIPIPTKEIEKNFENLLNKMDANLLDQKVYELYGLTKEEISFIESQ